MLIVSPGATSDIATHQVSRARIKWSDLNSGPQHLTSKLHLFSSCQVSGVVWGVVWGALVGQENKKTPPTTLSGTIHCLVESCLNASYKYAEALQAHFNYCIGERGREGGGRKEGEGRGGYTVKLKQMPVKEPPYVLVLIISTFVGTTTRLVLPLLVSSI